MPTPKAMVSAMPRRAVPAAIEPTRIRMADAEGTSPPTRPRATRLRRAQRAGRWAADGCGARARANASRLEMPSSWRLHVCRHAHGRGRVCVHGPAHAWACSRSCAGVRTLDAAPYPLHEDDAPIASRRLRTRARGSAAAALSGRAAPANRMTAPSAKTPIVCEMVTVRPRPRACRDCAARTHEVGRHERLAVSRRGCVEGADQAPRRGMPGRSPAGSGRRPARWLASSAGRSATPPGTAAACGRWCARLIRRSFPARPHRRMRCGAKAPLHDYAEFRRRLGADRPAPHPSGRRAAGRRSPRAKAQRRSAPTRSPDQRRSPASPARLAIRGVAEVNVAHPSRVRRIQPPIRAHQSKGRTGPPGQARMSGRHRVARTARLPDSVQGQRHRPRSGSSRSGPCCRLPRRYTVAIAVGVHLLARLHGRGSRPCRPPGPSASTSARPSGRCSD